MIEFKTGNILAEDAEALVNTVNCVGIMGRGIALQFKNQYPDNFKFYAAACKRNEVRPGSMLVFETQTLTFPHYIINFPTKRHWRAGSRIEDIDSGLEALAREIRVRKLQSIAIPPLGSGLGGLDWRVVRKHIENFLNNIDGCSIIVFEPHVSVENDSTSRSRVVPKMTEGRAALVGLMHRYMAGLLDPFITLLEVHKLMYFMQVAGQPLRLRYSKGPYGPFAENLSHVLNAVEGHLMSGYADGGDAPHKQLQLIPGALENAQSFLRNDPATNSRLERVSELVDGFESPFGLELLATVHWVVTEQQANTYEDVVAKTYAWSDRKKQFSKRQIRIAMNTLEEKGWIG